MNLSTGIFLALLALAFVFVIGQWWDGDWDC